MITDNTLKKQKLLLYIFIDATILISEYIIMEMYKLL